MTNERLTNLLAHRDGEPLELSVAADIESDSQARDTLAQLRGIKHALNELPAIDPGLGSDWFAEVQADRDAPQRSWFAQHRVATAASVFFAAALSMLVWYPEDRLPDSNAPGSVAVVDDPGSDDLAALVARSQRLEYEVVPAGGVNGGEPSATQRALLYRIAEIDSELSRVLEEESMDDALRQRLWQQRVDLLESLLEVRRAQISTAF